VSRTPVDLGIAALVDDLLQDLGIEELGEVLADEGEPLLRSRFRHLSLAVGWSLCRREGGSDGARWEDSVANVLLRDSVGEQVAVENYPTIDCPKNIPTIGP
jgi:sulfur carrier protein ThiS